MNTEIQKAVNLLQNGEVVGIPTETVYGLAGSIESPAGIEKIFAIKERPFFDPLIVHIASIKQAQSYTTGWNNLCDLLAENFWPGPLTMVLPKTDQVNNLITAGLDSVGLRMPKHELTLELIKTLGHPVAAPSANKFKKTSPTTAAHVKESFSEVFVLDGGACEVGIESTVVGVFSDRIAIYRPGMITQTQIENILQENNIEASVETMESPVAPGQLRHHYMPEVPVILTRDSSLLETIDPKLKHNIGYLDLGDNPALAARNLYQSLRELDKKHSSIVIKLNPKKYANDEWSGIINRIEKAASIILPEKKS